MTNPLRGFSVSTGEKAVRLICQTRWFRGVLGVLEEGVGERQQHYNKEWEQQ